MSRWTRVSVWGATFIIGVGLGIFLIGQGLSQAALWATVLGLPIAILGALAGIWSVMLAGRTLGEARSAPSGETKNLKDASVELVDASIDPEIVVNLNPRLSAIDFKFINRGDATAVLHRFTLEILEFQLDLTPVLRYSYDELPIWLIYSYGVSAGIDSGTEAARHLKLTVKNDGWGDALEFEASLVDPVLNRLFPSPKLTFSCPVVPGGADAAFALGIEDADQSGLKQLKARRKGVLRKAAVAMTSLDASVLDDEDFNVLMSDAEKGHVREVFFSPRDSIGDRGKWLRDYISERGSEYLPVRLDMKVHYMDENDNQHSVNHSMWEVWIGGDGFRCDPPPAASALPPSEVYAVILDPEESRKRFYSLSRAIAPGDADRFHVLLAARKSGTFNLRLSFHVGRAGLVKSEPILVSFNRPRSMSLPSGLVDGASFQVHEGRLELGGIKGMRKWYPPTHPQL